MKKSEFLAMVQHELDTIKAKATAEEIGNLNLKEFNHSSTTECIYGLMTGRCGSPRAIDLYTKSFLRIGGNDWKYKPFSTQDMTEGDEYTPLEKYLYMVKAPQHKKIIQYLKNEIQTIKL